MGLDLFRNLTYKLFNASALALVARLIAQPTRDERN